MDQKQHDLALFRLMVLGPLISRQRLSRGELKKMLQELATRAYSIPGSKRSYLSSKTIESWYYRWLKGGFDALAPRVRSDHGSTSIPGDVQATILQLKQDNPARSLNTIKRMIESQGLVAKHHIARATLHRFLKQHRLSKRTVANANTIERRSFEAQHAGDIWYGDVMHGPSLLTAKGKRKTYLVSLMDDASRLIVHTAFCWGETALDIEGALKQAVLKRGLPKRLVIDNGAAYRAKTLQMICARLEIRLIYCRPYEPQGKGKLERWHRTFKEQFLSEIELSDCSCIEDFNARLWAWVDQIYHQQIHSSLNGSTPIERWRQDLIHVRPLGDYANRLDEHFYYHATRTVKKDGTVSWEGKKYEVPYELAGEKIQLVVDPHSREAIKALSMQGDYLGDAHPLNLTSNCQRKRQRPTVVKKNDNSPATHSPNEVALAYEKFQRNNVIADGTPLTEED